MNKSINHKFKQSIFIISIIITVIFLIINISLYIINNNYLVEKVEEENRAFLDITTHIINENEITVALEYVEHYTHIHEVNIEILNETDEMIFSSNISHKYTTRYRIDTSQGMFTIFMDNTDSVTVNRIEMNTIYVNVSLVIIYVIAIIILIRFNKKSSNQLNNDIRNIIELMDKEVTFIKHFHYSEFEDIYNSITLYLENIDILTEQKEMNMKGLAHDIKTPLTLVYSYFERVQKNEKISDEERVNAFESSKRINELLNDLIENKERLNNRNFNLSLVLSNKLKEHISIFSNKNIQINKDIQSDVYINWSQKDLTRILDNIISNAYYYSKENSQFDVKLEKRDKIILSFSSEPEKLDEVDLNSIFKKGYRGESSNSVNSYGKGYGLYLCKILLDPIGGKIEVNKKDGNVKFTILM